MLPAIAFLKAQGCDQSGRMVADYLNWPAPMWEACHDHMQWAFPTRNPSAFNPNAPLIPADFVFDGDPDVKATIGLLFLGYLDSLHLEFKGGVVNWEDGAEPEGTPFWMDSRDHNTLRMTRVLECLGIFGLTQHQEALYNFLVFTVAKCYFHTLNAKTVAFWVAAKENKLHLVR